MTRFLLLLNLLFIPLFAQQPYVEAIQEGAQVLRDGKRLPLSPDMALKEGDEIITNTNARAYLFFPDRSRIKLGENSRFVIQQFKETPGRFESILNPIVGAFRYTAEKINKARQTDIQIKTATIGIRGTDIWGRVGGDEAFVVLIEGNVSVDDRDTQRYLDSFRSVYNAENQKMEEVSLETLLEYAAETEIVPQP